MSVIPSEGFIIKFFIPHHWSGWMQMSALSINHQSNQIEFLTETEI